MPFAFKQLVVRGFWHNLSTLQASIDATGSPLTDEALTAAKHADAVILGAIGGPVSFSNASVPLPLYHS